MKPSRLQSVLGHLTQTRWPTFIWGPPGVGKSSIVQATAAALERPVLDIRASLLDPTDLRGIPSVQDGRAVWAPPSFLPRPDDAPGVLFFDELNAAPPLVQASLYQLTLDRRVGEYVLPEGWTIIAAGNRADDASITFRMPAALANRFVHLDFEVDFDDWKQWALGAGVHPSVVAFLGTRRELLFDMSHTDRGFPTPRTWEMLSDARQELAETPDALDVYVGIVGEGAAIEYMAYCREAITEEAIQVIIDAPGEAALPSGLGDVYALMSYLASRGAEPQVARAAGVVAGRLPSEMGVLLVRDVLRVNPKFVLDAGYQAFVAAHGDFLI